MKWNCQFGVCVRRGRRSGWGGLARIDRRRGMTWEFVTILMLVTFILGLFVGAGMVRPKG